MENLTEFVNIQSDMAALNSKGLLAKLLEDKTTKGSIVWGTDEYASLGEAFAADAPIRTELYGVIKTRVRKAVEQQTSRVKKHGEVFTPRWITDLMNDHIDEVWFGYKDAFKAERVDFKRKSWKRYVDSRRVEIACGEAPFLMTRYDVSTGVMIPVPERSGILDRKLRVVTENTRDIQEWLEWALRSVQATYGYEFQGDNLLISRVNMLMTVEEFFEHRWQQNLSQEFKERLARVIAWNLWQMDGMTGMTPYFQPNPAADYLQNDLFSGEYVDPAEQNSIEQHICKTYDWRRDNSKEFIHAKEGERPMKFDFVIGNPPYQDEAVGEQKKYAPPIYNLFMDESHRVGDVVELIHPARFLFNAGGTPKKWNEKMLNNPHFKILFHEQNSGKVFPNTDIKGGIVISYYDRQQDFGVIGIYTAFDELNGILKKVKSTSSFKTFSEIIASRGLYRFSKKVYSDWPEEMEKLSDSRVGASAFERLPELFTENKPVGSEEYVRFYGLLKSKRVYRWFRKDYFKMVESFLKYKVLVPAANGSGALGEVLSTPVIGQPVIGQPVIGHTETFMSIGCFDTEKEAIACYKYICSKFCRVMLGVLKITQHNSPEKWAYVPMQDFSSNSDIDWSKSIPEIDQQLYKKYGLNEEEIEFIESHAKEMS